MYAVSSFLRVMALAVMTVALIGKFNLAHAGPVGLNSVSLVAAGEDNIYWENPYDIANNDGRRVIAVTNPNFVVKETRLNNGENEADSFYYNPAGGSPGAAAPTAAQNTIRGAVGLIRNRISAVTLASCQKPGAGIFELLLADSGTIVSDVGNGYGIGSKRHDYKNLIFSKPYLTAGDRSRNGGMGYETTTIGLVAGYERILSSSILIGIHGGAGKMDIDYTGTGYSDNFGNVELFSFGAHSVYFRKNWHMQASSTFYRARHDYEGLTGMNLEMTETYNATNYGSETVVTVGYSIGLRKVAIMPEFGVAHSWLHGESHTTDADIEAWETRYRSFDDHVFKSILGVRVMGVWTFERVRVTPTLGLRWEEALNDNTITVSQSLPGTSPVKVSENVDNTSIVTDASLLIAGDRTSVEIGFVREKNNDYTANGGSVTFRVAF